MNTKLIKYTHVRETLSAAVMTNEIRGSEIEEVLDNLNDASPDELERVIGFLTDINMKINKVSDLLGDIIEDLKGGNVK